jgi:hypothetical protein
VKKKLIDIDKTQQWLASEVAVKLGRKPDPQQLNKILAGTDKSKPITDAVSEILGIGS